MYKKLKKSIIFFISLIALGSLCLNADAYVLSGPHLLELMTKKLGKAKSLYVSQKLILYDDSLEDGEIELNETLKYMFPETFRSDIVSKSAERIHVVSNGVSLTVLDGKIVADHETRFDCYKDIILYNSRSLLEKRLTRCGINVSVSSLGRFQGRARYILGAQYPDESSSQVWLDKETFRPFRMVLKSKIQKSRSDSLEVRYLGWRQVKKIWYPMRIEFYIDDSLVRIIQVEEIRADLSFSKGLFDISHLRSIYPLDAQVPLKQNRYKELSEVQKMIEEFKKIYE